ncbi:MAG: iron uptake porin [Microcoleaceae cyanobacterium]
MKGIELDVPSVTTLEDLSLTLTAEESEMDIEEISLEEFFQRYPLVQQPTVNQLTDVQPTDWAYQALQSLIEQYQCIAGYPDNTFRGDLILTRYEFAASLNECLTSIRNLAEGELKQLANSEDVEVIERLQIDFATELAALRGRILGLEAQVAELEANQFSTTTKLSGFNTITVQGRTSNTADINPRDGDPETDDPENSINVPTFSYLQLSTWFSSRSLLQVGMLNIAGSAVPRYTDDVRLNDVRLGTDFFDTRKLVIGELTYRFLIGEKLAAFVGAINVNAVTAFRGPNRYEGAVTGPVSFFAQRNPLLNIGFGQTGLGFDWQFAERASLQAVYSSNVVEFFGGEGHNTAAVQLAITPIDPVDLTVYYVYDYSPDGNLFSFVGDEQLTAIPPDRNDARPLRTHGVGATLNWQISPKVVLGGWFGYTSSFIPGESGRVETTNYMVYLNFPDLFGEGDLGGIYVGQPPKIVHSNLPDGNNIPDKLNTGEGKSGGQPGTTTHIETFYRWQLTDNISVTPGFILLFEPLHSPNSDPIFVGVLRTTFLF